MEATRKKEIIKAIIAIACITLAIIIVGLINFKYSIEGEANMPYELSKITIVSTAEGVENVGTEEKWNFSVFQNNDIYFSIEKNENNKENEIIENVSIENIKITKEPKIGKIKTYMPNSLDGRLFSYLEDYVMEENNITFKGAGKSNSKTLEIGNQGGTIVLRFANSEVGKYISNEDEEIKHDGSLIEKVGVNSQDINFEVSFDIRISLRNRSYISNISLELPCENDLINNGTCTKEITDKFVFKRAKN